MKWRTIWKYSIGQPHLFLPLLFSGHASPTTSTIIVITWSEIMNITNADRGRDHQAFKKTIAMTTNGYMRSPNKWPEMTWVLHGRAHKMRSSLKGKFSLKTPTYLIFSAFLLRRCKDRCRWLLQNQELFVGRVIHWKTNIRIWGPILAMNR